MGDRYDFSKEFKKLDALDASRKDADSIRICPWVVGIGSVLILAFTIAVKSGYIDIPNSKYKNQKLDQELTPSHTQG